TEWGRTPARTESSAAQEAPVPPLRPPVLSRDACCTTSERHAQPKTEGSTEDEGRLERHGTPRHTYIGHGGVPLGGPPRPPTFPSRSDKRVCRARSIRP